MAAARLKVHGGTAARAPGPRLAARRALPPRRGRLVPRRTSRCRTWGRWPRPSGRTAGSAIDYERGDGTVERVGRAARPRAQGRRLVPRRQRGWPAPDVPRVAGRRVTPARRAVRATGGLRSGRVTGRNRPRPTSATRPDRGDGPDRRRTSAASARVVGRSPVERRDRIAEPDVPTGGLTVRLRLDWPNEVGVALRVGGRTRGPGAGRGFAAPVLKAANADRCSLRRGRPTTALPAATLDRRLCRSSRESRLPTGACRIGPTRIAARAGPPDGRHPAVASLPLAVCMDHAGESPREVMIWRVAPCPAHRVPSRHDPIRLVGDTCQNLS